MKARQKRCPFCRRIFKPDPHARIQKCCGRAACQRARKRRNLSRWRNAHPEHAARYAVQERAWARDFPDYWRNRRRSDPGYAARDDKQRTERRRRAKLSANETGLRRILVEKMRALDQAEVSANETGLSRRVDAMADCLRSTAMLALSANETGMAG